MKKIIPFMLIFGALIISCVKVKKEEPVVKMDSQPATPAIVNESIKTREDGSRYKEIEYIDGTMEVVELNET